jgi:tryptophan synthase alpha chain
MNRLAQLFLQKKKILNIYVTAGFPNLNDTVTIVQELEKNGVDLVELGMPYSDPLADGPAIQHSSAVALSNGMKLSLLFKQIKEIRKTSSIPLVLMGYFNQMMRYGVDEFLEQAAHCGIDGLIIPDLPVQEYITKYKQKAEQLELDFIFLISPQTESKRIRLLDEASRGFLYVVSSTSTTGKNLDVQQTEQQYFERIQNMGLKNPLLIGFGISNKESYQKACSYASGAIIGSAFIRALEQSSDIKKTISQFIQSIRS